MRSEMKNKMKMVSFAMVVVGVTGVILFFPLNLDNAHTCFFHRLFSGDQGINPGWAGFGTIPGEAEQHKLLQKYLVPFGFIWWFSLALVGWGIVRLRHRKNTANSPIRHKQK